MNFSFIGKKITYFLEWVLVMVYYTCFANFEKLRLFSLRVVDRLTADRLFGELFFPITVFLCHVKNFQWYLLLLILRSFL